MKKSYWFFLVIILFVSACRAPKELVYQGVQNLSMKPGGKSAVTLDIRLYNPNGYNLKLKHSDVDVSLNGTSIGKLHMDGRLLAPRKDTFLLPVMLDVSVQNPLAGIFQLIMTGEVDVKLTGNIKAGRHGIYINVPVNYEGKQDLMQGMKKF